MRCPHTHRVVNPSFIRRYNRVVGEEYRNAKGGTSWRNKFDTLAEYEAAIRANLPYNSLEVPPFLEVPCGKCSICMSNKKQDWIYRCKQELDASPGGMFITLTYDDINLPFRDSLGNFHRLADEVIINEEAHCSLCKEDFQKYMKRLRKSLEPLKVRFFAVGEYGGKHKRPHYHLLLFGLPYSLSDEYDPLRIIQTPWPFGNVDIGELNGSSINYVISYLDMKGYKPHEYSEEQFALMSRRPGLGANKLWNNDFTKFFTEKRLMENSAMVAHDGLKMPLPRYYKDKLYTQQQRYKKQSYDYRHKPVMTEYDMVLESENYKLAAHKENIINQRATRKKLHA